MDDAAHWLVSYQHLFFYPLMAFGRRNLLGTLQETSRNLPGTI